MPFNGSGVYTAPSLPGSFSPAVTGQDATPADWNTLLADLSTALSTTVTSDGQSTITADIPLNNHKITGLANGTATTDAAAFGQIISGVNGWSTNPALGLGPQSVSAGSELTFTGIDATINQLMCVFEFKPGTDAALLNMRTAGADGVFDTGGTDYYWNVLLINTALTAPTVGGATASVISLSGGIDNGNTGIGGDFTSGNIQAATKTKFNFRLNYLDNTGTNGIGVTGYGARNEADRITGIQFFFSPGTITGRATLYGST